MCPVLRSPFHSLRPDFARVISRKFEQGRFLVIGADPQKLERQFAETGREAVVCESYADLAVKLHQDTAVSRFEVALWFYPGEESEDDRVAEELSRYASEIVLTAGAGANVSKRRPKLVGKCRRFGFLPHYDCDLTGIDTGAVRLVHQQPASAKSLVPGSEPAFARVYACGGRL